MGLCDAVESEEEAVNGLEEFEFFAGKDDAVVFEGDLGWFFGDELDDAGI